MSSTYTSLHYHIIYSTKHRIPNIHPTWRPELHRYLAGTVKGLKGHPIQVGGVDDHVHLLVSLTASHCIMDFLRELKKASSGWVHTHVGVKEFRWQVGYAAFTVSPNGRDGVAGYVRNQEIHHRGMTFIEELKMLLEQAGIEYDPRYLE
jgi:REP element-mobilizing transposase RayT